MILGGLFGPGRNVGRILIGISDEISTVINGDTSPAVGGYTSPVWRPKWKMTDSAGTHDVPPIPVQRTRYDKDLIFIYVHARLSFPFGSEKAGVSCRGDANRN